MKAPNVKCDQCGVLFYREPIRIRENNFCCQKCRVMSLRKEPVAIKCDQCGAKVYKAPAKASRGVHHFCSIRCTYKFRTIKQPVKCDQCEIVFYRAPAATNRHSSHFCSRKCRSQWQIKKEEIICDNCDLVFTLSGRTLVDKRAKKCPTQFCSRKCQYEYATKEAEIKKGAGLHTRAEVCSITRRVQSLANIIKEVEQCRT
jgi:hypothetical protein